MSLVLRRCGALSHALLLALVLSAAALPHAEPAAAGGCPKQVAFVGSGVRSAEYMEVIPRPAHGKQRVTEVGDPVSDGRLDVMATYYVTGKNLARFTSGGVTYTVRSGTFFIPYCLDAASVHVRVLDGRADASGPGSSVAAARMSTVEAVGRPYPGRPDFRVMRHWTTKARTTVTTFSVPDDDAARLFVTASNIPGQRKVPCQAGGRVRIYADGRVG